MTLVSHAMNRSLVTVAPDAPVSDALALVRRTGAEHVLVMEDQEMHVGELPNTDGFLVLDLFQMRMLFSASAEEMPEIRHEHAERLSVIELRRDVLARHANLRLRETCDAVKKVSPLLPPTS